MATIIDCGDGRFIAGDPASELQPGEEWCSDCGGSGLEYDYDGELEVCGGCDGYGVTILWECVDAEGTVLFALTARDEADAVRRVSWDERAPFEGAIVRRAG